MTSKLKKYCGKNPYTPSMVDYFESRGLKVPSRSRKSYDFLRAKKNIELEEIEEYFTQTV